MVSNAGSFSATASSTVRFALAVQSNAPGNGLAGGSVRYTGTAFGLVGLVLGAGSASDPAVALRVDANGGAGSNGSSGQAGGAAGPLDVSMFAATTRVTTGGASNSIASALFGLRVAAVGGAGGASTSDSHDGGAGGAGGPVTATLSQSTVSLSYPGGLPGAALSLQSVGGAGGTSQESSTAGAGGSAAPVSLSVNGGSVTSTGTNLDAVALQSTGGQGGSGSGVAGHTNKSDAGAGGAASGSQLTVQATSVPLVIATSGDNAAGAAVRVTGGAGNRGATTGTFVDPGQAGGAGGRGGDVAGASTLQSSGPVFVTTGGAGSPGLVVSVRGGDGGRSGDTASSTGDMSRAPGAGGAAAASVVNLGAGITITTGGGTSSAVVAQSLGGGGGNGGEADTVSADQRGVDGGRGGDAGPVTVTTAAGVTLTTSGSQSHGLLAQSFSGGGGLGGVATSSFAKATSGVGGSGGNAAGVTVTHAGTIGTTGSGARGILAQTLSGAGGSGGYSSSTFDSNGGGGGASGSVGPTVVVNLGRITTSGAGSEGVLAQSISGGGGTGGQSSGAIYTVGGAGNTDAAASNGGMVSLDNTGTIVTQGEGAAGMVGQSIGGGGGAGGSVSGLVVNVGGTGAGGGAGGTVAFGNSKGSTAGSISTSGSLSNGVLLQSIGGGGGTGGNSTGASFGASAAVGGTAGSGGSGGTVQVSLGTIAITTTGTGSSGVVGQSVGGGGGSGGGAYSIAATPVASFAASVGGGGGAGGDGGNVGVTITGGTVTTGRAAAAAATPAVDSLGILAQSIGGGGGVGGGASAAAVAIAIPTGPSGTASTLTGVYSAGGSGGSGGMGGTAIAIVSTGSRVTTAGAGSIGVLSQSIGGGGGQGGDSSAFAATLGYVPSVIPTEAFGTESVSVNVAVGGSGGSGGAGGSATASVGTGNPLDLKPGVFSTITTTGDGASGLAAQSVGGGGGNAGVGSARLGSAGKVSTLGATVTLGATGGQGGAGGASSVVVDPDGVVLTTGSGASGVVVQSIGGGGGTSSGGSLNLSGIKDIKVNGQLSVSPSIAIALGARGGAGGSGGAAVLTHQGSITTVGNDAPGAIVQSIGGGGGIGGAAGTDTAATGDATEPAPTGAAVRTAQAAADDPSVSIPSVTLDVKTSVSLGGKGGSAGNGGGVTVSLSGAFITTSGDFSPGLIAQSVGGGGGRGGSAVGGGEDNSLRSFITSLAYSSTVSLGAAGGGATGGDGGPVNATLYGTIRTGLRGQGSAGSGFQSFGVLAQSVGGGGGMGSDGTPDPSGVLLLGAGLGGGGGAAGSGGAVTVQEGSAQLHAYTYGDAAHAVVLQSVGGGGGVGGAGGTVTSPAVYAASFTTSLGATGSSGNGGTVKLDFITINPVTTGSGAFGILAQSVGGGGGLAMVGGSPATSATLARLGGGNGNGGAVTVTAGSNSTTMTSGVGSHGIVAQSVGGGGGIYAVVPAAGSSPGFSQDPGLVPGAAGVGSGGDVTVTSQGVVAVTGNGSIGILAQSVGAGGGIAVQGGQTFLGSTGGAANGSGGRVEVDVSKSVTAAGVNGIGVYAQSTGTLGAVIVSLRNGIVQGGSGAQGAGIVIAGSPSGIVTLDPASAVSALSGVAIGGGTAASPITVNNAGVITGSMNLGSGSVSGAGTLVPAGASVITGNVILSPGGAIAPAADFAAGTAGSYRILGNASFAGGVVRPTLASVVANIRLPVLTVTGTTSGTIAAAPSALFDFSVLQTATAAGLRFDLVASGSHFGDGRYALSPGRAAVATGLQSLFSAGAPQYGAFFADLDAVASSQPGEYVRRLAQLGPRSALTVGARRAADAAGIANASMSCPVFATGAAFLTEGACAYFKPGVRTTSDRGDTDRSHFQQDSAVWQVGGQQEIAPGLFLGGSLAYERSWISSGDGVKGGGSAGQGALTLKYQTGPWLLTGAAFGSAGGTDLQRVVDVPGIGGVAKGSPSNASAGVRARVAYTVGGETVYVRPYLNVDGLYARSGAYQEYGAGAFGLGYAAASQTTAVITPAVEFGGRVALGPAGVLRGFVSAGASIRTNDAWKAGSRLLAAPAGAGWFTTSVQQDRASARVGAGVQLFQGDRIDLRAQYDGDYGSRSTTHGGSLTFAYRL